MLKTHLIDDRVVILTYEHCHSSVMLNRAVYKWLSKVLTRLRLLRLVIGLKDLRQFFNQWEAKPKPIAPCTRDFSRASGELQIIARNCDWFMELFVPVVIGRSNCFWFWFFDSQLKTAPFRMKTASENESDAFVNCSCAWSSCFSQEPIKMGSCVCLVWPKQLWHYACSDWSKPYGSAPLKPCSDW